MIFKILPKKAKKMNQSLTLATIKSFQNATSAPVVQLKKEAAEFEELILSRRAIKK